MVYRGRRLRINPGIRNMVRENHLQVENLIYPLFLVEGNNIKKEISALKGQYHLSIDKLDDELDEIVSLGIPAVLLFGLPAYKDEMASSAYAEDGIVQKGIRKIKEKYPDLVVITDVCLCQYTSHGHCGVLEDNTILNDPSVDLIAKTALSHAKAGADMVAPSDMMDGRIAAIRELLDIEGYEYTPIMVYSVKYASSFYGPFREVADSSPKSGDRKSYQMDFANSDEAIREAEADLDEGADILMVKPAMAYQDIIYRLKQNFECPIAAYNVSGEYAMIKSAAQQGLIDEKSAVLEALTGIKRSGADLIITYFAKDVARWLRK
ncbi:MAG: hypothetical protein ACD_20C00118G0013 [uncultured bacterium]|nr:MAG: hypothetical protein ACD_20C00118G0013 [uncultured bacterium]